MDGNRHACAQVVRTLKKEGYSVVQCPGSERLLPLAQVVAIDQAVWHQHLFRGWEYQTWNFRFDSGLIFEFGVRTVLIRRTAPVPRSKNAHKHIALQHLGPRYGSCP